jgi:hypothetical protein
MLNVNELTSRMAKMSDAQLRQYAQIHKNDPYTLALAASESKRRAQLRAAAQQQATQPQQPTVADQAIAQMGAPAPQPQLPEQQGIGVLPAQNVAGMADGGIAGYEEQYINPYADAYANGGVVAFKDKGFVDTATEYMEDKLLKLPTLPGWATPALPILTGGLYGENARRSLEDPNTSSPVGRFFENFRAPDARQKYEEQQKFLAQERALAAKLQQLEGYGLKQQTPQQQAEAKKVRAELDALRGSRTPTTTSQSSTLEQFQAPPPVKKEAGWAVAGKKRGEKSSYPAPIDESAGYAGEVYTHRPLPPNSPYLDPNTYINVGGPFNLNTQAGRNAAMRQGKTKTVDQQPPPIETMKVPTGGFTPSKETTMAEQLEALKRLSPGTQAYDDLKRDIESGFSRLQKEREASKPKGKPYEGLEALLAKEEDKAKGKEARNFNMALVNAGLAIAGGRSKNALQNIAEGAQVGTKQYQEGLEKLEAAAVERRKQAALIEEARRAEARGDWKEANDYKQKAFEAGIGVDKERISAVQEIFKTNSKTAADIVNTANTNASNDRRAQYQQENENFRAQLREAGDNWRLVAKNANDIKVAQVYASARAMYGANAGDKIWDNARQRHDSWLRTPEGRMADSATADAKFQQYLTDATNAYGGGGNKNPQSNPYAGWGSLHIGPPKK